MAIKKSNWSISGDEEYKKLLVFAAIVVITTEILRLIKKNENKTKRKSGKNKIK